MTEDRVTNTPEDATRFERMYGDDSMHDDRPDPSDFYEGEPMFEDHELADDGWEHPPWCTLPPFHAPWATVRLEDGYGVVMCEPLPSFTNA